MSLIQYPTTNYNSMVSLDEADSHFADDLYATEFNASTDAVKSAALVTAFRMLTNELDLDLDFDDLEEEEQEALELANLLQANHLIKMGDPSTPSLNSLDLGKVLTVKLDQSKNSPQRICVEALRALRSYITLPSITVSR
jgi:hypothetical protein